MNSTDMLCVLNAGQTQNESKVHYKKERVDARENGCPSSSHLFRFLFLPRIFQEWNLRGAELPTSPFNQPGWGRWENKSWLPET